jgi:hypothetical protein
VQGSVLLPDKEFFFRIVAHDRAFDYGYGTANCLSEWSNRTGTTFTHVYITDTPSGQHCCWNLLPSLRQYAEFEEIYSGPGAIMFAKRTPESPMDSNSSIELDSANGIEEHTDSQ